MLGVCEMLVAWIPSGWVHFPITSANKQSDFKLNKFS